MGALAVPAFTLGGSLIGKLFGGGGGGGGNTGAQAGLKPGIAGTLQGANFLSSTGQPLLTQAATYYRNLLGTSKSGVQSAIAPAVAGVTDAARGARSSIEATMRGPQRDQAEANLSRDTAGRVGLLPFQARTQALEGASALGMDASKTGAGLFADLVRPGEEARQFNDKESAALGEGLGKIFGQVGGGLFSGPGGKFVNPFKGMFGGGGSGGGGG
jgi:hypothetical protein